MSSLNLCDIPSEMIRLIAERADTRTRYVITLSMKNGYAFLPDALSENAARTIGS